MTVLGTAAAAPTRERGLPAVALEREGELLLFDCGEGTQRQMAIAKPAVSNPKFIFITHLHGDHLLGLFGLIQSLALQDRAEPLPVFGPRGLDRIIKFNIDSLRVFMPYRIVFHRVTPGVVLRGKEFTVRAQRTMHTDDSYAYRLDEASRPGKFYPEKALQLGVPRGPLWGRLQGGRSVKVGSRVVLPREVSGPRRKGRSFGYSGDTRPTRELVRFFQGVDLLVFDGTFSEEYAEKAKEYLHSTVTEAAELAAEAKVGRLLLTHLSARTNDTDMLRNQAMKHFKPVEIAEDFSTVELPLSE